jgi:hypothetical protein
MKFNQNTRLVVWAVALFFATCAQATVSVEKNWVVESSISHSVCPWSIVGPVGRVFTGAAQWNEVVFKSEDVALQAPVDWKIQDVLVFSLGTQPHLGTTVKLDKHLKPLRIQGRTARLQVRVSRPPPGSSVATALSQPCVMAVVRKRPWYKLEVRQSDSGAVLWQGRLDRVDRVDRGGAGR